MTLHRGVWVRAFVLIAFISIMRVSAHADVALPGILASEMVIQRDRPVTIWGWADQGERVTIELGGKVVATVIGQGKQVAWRVQLPPQKAGPVPDIRVAGSTNSITLVNVLAGEVWLCAGQSNMAMTVDGSGPGQRIGAVRYAFLLGPETPLHNSDGLPAFPFRSDDWAIVKAE